MSRVPPHTHPFAFLLPCPRGGDAPAGDRSRRGRCQCWRCWDNHPPSCPISVGTPIPLPGGGSRCCPVSWPPLSVPVGVPEALGEGGRVLTCCPAPRRAEGQRHRALLQLPAQLQRLPHPAEGRGPRPHVRGQQGLRPLPRPARHQPRAPHCKLPPLGLGTRRGRGAGCPEGPSWW